MKSLNVLRSALNFLSLKCRHVTNETRSAGPKTSLCFLFHNCSCFYHNTALICYK